MIDFATTDDYERLMIVVRGGTYLLEQDAELRANETERFNVACNIQIAYDRLQEDTSPYKYQLNDEDARIVRLARSITCGPIGRMAS